MLKSLQKNNYLPAVFTDKNRLSKIQATFPLLHEIYTTHAEKNHIPGYAFGVVVDNELVYSGSHGYIDIDNQIQATTQSMFRIASMTKSFTAMAIVKLRDEGKLRLDDPVYLYIPEIQNQQLTTDSPIITIRDLLTHSAGFPQDDPWADRQLSTSPDELMALIKSGINFSNVPGTTYEYSNLTFTLLGYIIEKVSGIPYQTFITTHICQTLGMHQVAWEFTKVPEEQLVYGYKWIDNTWQKEELLHDGIFGAMGGMFTSIESFSHYVALHLSAWPPRNDPETHVLKRSSLREMQQPWRFHELQPHYHYLNGRESAMTSAYGYGLRWLKNSEAEIYVGHSGGLPGFGSNWLIMPEYGIGVMLFTNVTYAPAADINMQVLDTLIQKAQLKPRQLPPSDILKNTQNALMKLLPHWQHALIDELFAENFFLDYAIEVLKHDTIQVFEKLGTIIYISEVVPENQLRGYFTIEGKKTTIKISFTLTPQNPALIQTFKIEEI